LSNNYSWQFPRLDVYPTYQTLTDVVCRVHWRMTADDGGGHIAQAYGVQQCGDVDPNDFVLYADLTESQVQGWVEAAMGTDGINEIKAYLDQRISEIVNPIELSLPPPWL